jgi:Uma2 family endonuclease
MAVAALVLPGEVSLDDYLQTAYHPDCDFLDGELVERNVGKRKHSFAQGRIVRWFGLRATELALEPLPEMRLRVSAGRVRVPDVVVCALPLPDEEVFTEPPYICIEILSPDDTTRSMQQRLDDYVSMGVPNLWVVDPWEHRGWTVTAARWFEATEGALRTSDGFVSMPLAEVLLP